MIAYGGTALLFWFVCGMLSQLTRKERPYLNSPGFTIGGLLFLFPTLLAMIWGARAATGHPAYAALLVVVALIPGVILALPWLLQVIGQATEDVGRALVSAENMTVRRSYDEAERLLRERKFDEAERAFLADAGEEKEDPEPLRGAGQAALAAGRLKDAVNHFRRALSLLKSEEDRASLAIRIAEIEERKMGDAAAARRTLEAVLPDLWPGKWGDYVRERLERIGT
jgi:tetratricopeptide (TPR) repeat protein